LAAEQQQLQQEVAAKGQQQATRFNLDADVLNDIEKKYQGNRNGS
jgi:hypothetical protein